MLWNSNRRAHLVALASITAFGLAACGDSDSPNPLANTAELSVIHASADAPAVDGSLNGLPFGNALDFKSNVPNQLVSSGTAGLTVRGVLPGSSR